MISTFSSSNCAGACNIDPAGTSIHLDARGQKLTDNLGQGIDTGQVLGLQPRLRAIGPDVVYFYGLPEEGGQRHGGSLNLATPLPLAAVNKNSCRHISYYHNRWIR